MHFPGDEYLLWSQNPCIHRDLDVYRDLGFTRLLYDDKVPERAFEKELKAIRSGLPGYQVIKIEDGWAYEFNERTIVRHPVWDLKAGYSGYKLRKLAEEYETIFVRNTFTNAEMIRRDGDQRIWFRELWEIMNMFPNTRFIVFGIYQLQLYFLFGFSGGAMAIRDNYLPSGQPGHVRRLVDDRGEKIGNAREPDWEEHPLIGKIPNARTTEQKLIWVGLRLIQHIAEYIKQMYSTRPRLPEMWDEKSAPKAHNKYILSPHPPSKSPFSGLFSLAGDKNLCDDCSLKYACRLYKEGSVCTLPGTEGKRLSDFVGSTDAKEVIKGIGHLLSFQANRVEDAIQAEIDAKEKAKNRGEDDPAPDPEIFKMMTEIQKNATSYAKILNPSLMKPQTAVQVNVGTGQTTTVTAEQQPVTAVESAQAVRELEQAGVSRSDIDPQMVFDHIARKNGTKTVQPVIDQGGFQVDY